jgi:L-lactate dehydrogenase complex protein LldF
VAETGGFVVVTNEGNADLGTALPPVHVACMGIEKLVPRLRDLPVFLRLLARSATGQAITSYTSHFHGPREGGELHVVLVDNGRSALLARARLREVLGCIRCGACLNTCPVFRRSGGHSYGSTIPGPVGSVLEPARDPARHASLPYACTLCGSCADVCPVKIPLPAELLALRGDLVREGRVRRVERFALVAASRLLSHPRLYAAAGLVARRIGRALPRSWLSAGAGPWTRGRELPELPPESFRELYARRVRWAATKRVRPAATRRPE